MTTRSFSWHEVATVHGAMAVKFTVISPRIPRTVDQFIAHLETLRERSRD